MEEKSSFDIVFIVSLIKVCFKSTFLLYCLYLHMWVIFSVLQGLQSLLIYINHIYIYIHLLSKSRRDFAKQV